MRALKPIVPESVGVDDKRGFPWLCQMRSICPASEKALLLCTCPCPPSPLPGPPPPPVWALQSTKPPRSLHIYVATGSCCCLRLIIFAAVDTSARRMKARSDLPPHATSSLPLSRVYRLFQVSLATAVVKALVTWHLQIFLHYLVSRGWLEVILAATLFGWLGAAPVHLLCRGDSTVTA